MCPIAGSMALRRRMAFRIDSRGTFPGSPRWAPRCAAGSSRRRCRARRRSPGRWPPELLEQERLAGGDLVVLGVAVSRGPALQDVADVDLLAAEPHGVDDLREKLPARPTGRPCLSSSSPGASPTKTSLARALPSPKTMCFRVRCSGQRVRSPSSSRTPSGPRRPCGRPDRRRAVLGRLRRSAVPPCP